MRLIYKFWIVGFCMSLLLLAKAVINFDQVIAQQKGSKAPATSSTQPQLSEETSSEFEKASDSGYQKEPKNAVLPDIQEKEIPVKINSIDAFTTIQGMPIYKVNYSYEFNKLDNVYIRGLGLVSAKGNFIYLTDNPQIEFRTSADGRIIPISYSSSPEHVSKYTIDLPKETDFSLSGRRELWISSTSFQEMAMKVFNKKNFPYYPYERDKIYYILSSYAYIKKDLPKNLHVQLAMLLSYPYSTSDGKILFQLKSTVRERRIKEDKWRSTISEEAQKASDKFINEFVSELLNIDKESNK